MILRRVALCAAVFVSLACGQARAQEDPDVAEARAQFVAGTAAVQAGRWADAAQSFQRSYELSNAPSALYNLGLALRALGRYRDARDAFATLMREHRAKLSRDMLQSSRRYRTEMGQHVASLELVGLRSGVRYEVRLDGREVTDDGSRPLKVEADPGSHHLSVKPPGMPAFEWEGSLSRGEGRAVRVHAGDVPMGEERPPVLQAGATGEGAGEDDDRSIARRPVFWVLSVLAVGAIAGLTSYFLLRDQRLDPESDMPVDL